MGNTERGTVALEEQGGRSYLPPRARVPVEQSVGAAVCSDRPAGLTDRQVEVLRLAARGHTRREIGRRLVITEHTVRHHLEHIYNKTGTANRVAATHFAMKHGLLVD